MCSLDYVFDEFAFNCYLNQIYKTYLLANLHKILKKSNLYASNFILMLTYPFSVIGKVNWVL